jgi:hypothetical protein
MIAAIAVLLSSQPDDFNGALTGVALDPFGAVLRRHPSNFPSCRSRVGKPKKIHNRHGILPRWTLKRNSTVLHRGISEEVTIWHFANLL